MSFKSAPKDHPYFKPKAVVEISSDDDGFRGSWYEGTIIRRASSKNPKKYLVKYKNLFSDESGTKHLREILDFSQLRPPAPTDEDRRFKFGDKVDAYHNDGWWEGSITEECGDGKFAVFFRGTREQIVFKVEDLRLHREWVDGEWEPPLQLKDKEDKHMDETKALITTEVKPIEAVPADDFSKGMLVEVSSDEEGFAGAWFTATIVEPVGKDKYLVEYQSLRTEDNTDFLREEIETLHIRPFPPETIVVDSFKLLDEVDAFYNDGWWVGVIAKVLADSKYVVYFRSTDERIMFRHSELRPHQDWVGGQWRVPSAALKL